MTDIEVNNNILNGNSLTKKNILIIAAHPDDEVLGLGGTILYHKKNGDNISVIFMSDGVTGRDFHYNRKKREEEISQRKLMSKMAFEYYGGHYIDFLDLPNLRMDQEPILELTKLIERKISLLKPSIIYTHSSSDTNIDHVITHKAVVIACRPIPNFIVESIRVFEVPSSTEYSVESLGPQFLPNLYIDISLFKEEKRKLLRFYDYEMRPYPHPRSYRALLARDIYRGSSVGLKYAEVFIEIRKVIKNN